VGSGVVAWSRSRLYCPSLAARLGHAMAPTRIATSLDASAIAADIAEAFAGYRAWAPSAWQPPVPNSTEIAQLASALKRPDVWCLLAFEGAEVRSCRFVAVDA
jgi:hypothetical protein